MWTGSRHGHPFQLYPTNVSYVEHTSLLSKNVGQSSLLILKVALASGGVDKFDKYVGPWLQVDLTHQKLIALIMCLWKLRRSFSLSPEGIIDRSHRHTCGLIPRSHVESKALSEQRASRIGSHANSMKDDKYIQLIQQESVQ
jgi:hypothetical protein